MTLCAAHLRADLPGTGLHSSQHALACVNNGRIRCLISRSDAVHNASVSSTGATRAHNIPLPSRTASEPAGTTHREPSMPLAEVADRAKVWRIVRYNHHKIVPFTAGSGDPPRRIQPTRIAVQ